MIWDKFRFRKYKDDRAIPLELGIRLSVDDMYKYHRHLKDKFQYVYVDLSHLKPGEKKQFFISFADTYKIVVQSPKYINSFDMNDKSFSKSIHYALDLLEISDLKLHGYVSNLSRHFQTRKEVAYNTLTSVYLKRVIPPYYRSKIKFMLGNSHMAPLLEDVFPLSHALTLSRRIQGVDLFLDTLSAYRMGAKLVDPKYQGESFSLSKDYHMMELSGIGKEGRTSIRSCTQEKSGAYIEFIKTFKRSIIILSTGSTELALGDWEYMETYLGYKKK